MTILAGQIITAGQLTRLRPTPYEVTASGNLALTTSVVDVPGASITLTTTSPNAIYVAVGTFSFDVVTATTAYAEGMLYVDGAQASGNARWSGEVNTDFGPAAQQWSGTLAAGGSHTLKLRGSASAAGIQILGAFTRLIVTIYEVP
ncbi:hypothetical protein STHAL_18115 [Streptomyces halstedii]|uniref:Minor tail protein n=1 Tax=Streptomyces halstedii TaxID=1944 RepID=A0ABS6TT29_STRHA|nr:hypothetical protein [Streptomyces halstedii]MBV7671367.1 hypothetical protein [Streptomyces halstedii]